MRRNKYIEDLDIKRENYGSNFEKRGKIQRFIERRMPNIAEDYEKIYIVKDEKVEELMAEIDTGLIERAKKELAEEETKQKEHYELLEKLNKEGFWHYCEVCGKKEFLTPDEAYNKGWDYPPKMGTFGVLAPRTCGECGITETLWWRVIMEKEKVNSMSELSEKQQKVLSRILFEPYSLYGK